jgi:hypothetical protein
MKYGSFLGREKIARRREFFVWMLSIIQILMAQAGTSKPKQAAYA